MSDILEPNLSYHEFKKRQRAALKKGNGAVQGDDIPPRPNVCSMCSGKKFIKTLFSGRQECAACEGAGFDMDDPAAVIRYQLYWLKKAKKQVLGYKRRVKDIEQLFTAEEVANRRQNRTGENIGSRFD